MDDKLRVEKWTLDDGRRAERRVMEQKAEEGVAERVIELHVEDERPLRLQQRVVEKTKPFIYERKVETLDPKTGAVVDQKVESIEPKVQMQLVEHIAASSTVAAQNVVEDDCDCHVTKEEMIETVIAAIKATREQMPAAAPVETVRQRKVRDRAVPTVQAQSVPAANFSNKLNSLGLAEEIAGRVSPQGYSTMDKVLMGVIAAQVIGLGYVIFWM